MPLFCRNVNPICLCLVCASHPLPQAYGFLYKDYRPGCYWWQSVAQLQQLALVACQVFTTSLSPFHQVTLLLITLLVNAATEVLASPAALPLASDLHFVSYIVLVLTLALSYFCMDGSVLADGTVQLSEHGVRAVGGLMLMLNLAFVAALLAGMAALMYLQKKRDRKVQAYRELLAQQQQQQP